MAAEHTEYAPTGLVGPSPPSGSQSAVPESLCPLANPASRSPAPRTVAEAMEIK
ncbi:hypothetical protein [Micromonospora noduli]|uniref:hypothetical protein n=1 Tax=Micromonospora noduli TaxID=709876 RepID=UPI00142DDDC6|nr:hypothetical protein [Micromonospora noduli]